MKAVLLSKLKLKYNSNLKKHKNHQRSHQLLWKRWKSLHSHLPHRKYFRLEKVTLASYLGWTKQRPWKQMVIRGQREGSKKISMTLWRIWIQINQVHKLQIGILLARNLKLRMLVSLERYQIEPPLSRLRKANAHLKSSKTKQLVMKRVKSKSLFSEYLKKSTQTQSHSFKKMINPQNHGIAYFWTRNMTQRWAEKTVNLQTNSRINKTVWLSSSS